MEFERKSLNAAVNKCINCCFVRYIRNDACENWSVQNNSPPRTSSSRHWYWWWMRADRWNGRHEPVTTQHIARQSLVSLTFCLIAVAPVTGKIKALFDVKCDFNALAIWLNNPTIFYFDVFECDAGFDLNKNWTTWFNKVKKFNVKWQVLPIILTRELFVLLLSVDGHVDSLTLVLPQLTINHTNH